MTDPFERKYRELAAQWAEKGYTTVPSLQSIREGFGITEAEYRQLLAESGMDEARPFRNERPDKRR